MNKKGVTLIELLGYLSLISVIILLIGNLMSFSSNSYNIINGQGGMYTEANFIMNKIITKTNSFKPQYIKSCGENCIELIQETEKVIDHDLGIPVDKTINKSVKIYIYNDDLYIDNLKLNNTEFKVISINQLYENSNISYTCYDNNEEIKDFCQQPIITIKLAIVRINKNGDIVTKPYISLNQFAI